LNAINVVNLKKSYDKQVVLNGVSFSIEKGNIFGLLGANGAGKTTTLECIEGLKRYDSGSIEINGSIGVQLQSSSLPNNIKAVEAFRLFCFWNGVSDAIDLLTRFLPIEHHGKQYGEMSTGQKRRLHLALALVKDPDIIFLDEPTAGLDVEGRYALHGEIRELKKMGKTIVLASHDMSEVETLCDSIAILKNSEIVFHGTPRELTKNYASKRVISVKLLDELPNTNFEHLEFIGINQGYYMFSTMSLHEGLSEILSISSKLIDVVIERNSLEDKFIEIAKEDN